MKRRDYVTLTNELLDNFGFKYYGKQLSGNVVYSLKNLRAMVYKDRTNLYLVDDDNHVIKSQSFKTKDREGIERYIDTVSI